MSRDSGHSSVERRRLVLERMGITQWVRRAVAPLPHAEAANRPASSAAGSATEHEKAATGATPRDKAIESFAKATSKHAEKSAADTAAEKSAQPAKQPVSKPAAAVEVVAQDWQSLEAEVAACTACELHRTRTQTVFGVGNREADWMIIGEAPGAEEDRRGEPFVGRAGQLLDLVLNGIGRPRDSVFIANILKCRPPSNRDPRAEEALACSGFLNRQIAWVKPKLILCVGRIAAQNLLGTTESTGKLRGMVHHHAASGTPVIVTYHPAYLLRRPIEKRKVWADLKLAEQTTRSQEQPA